MSGPRPVTAADAELAVALAASSTEELLRKAYALTHRIHSAKAVLHVPEVLAARQREADLRAQRDLLTAEILRRAGEQR